MGRLAGKVAVITGGAKGIGEGIARRFSEEGAYVAIADIDERAGRETARELGERADFYHCDVKQEEQVAEVINCTVESKGQIDCMVNNAGYDGVTLGIAELSSEEFMDLLSVHLVSVFYGMKHAAKQMIAQQSGSIINISSVAGLWAGYGNHAYSAAKAGVNHITKTASMELGRYDIRVNAICPGGILTSILGNVDLEKVKEIFSGFQPIHRSGTVEDVSGAALFLASDDSSYVSGQLLGVEGGLTTGRKWEDFLGVVQQFRDLRSEGK